MLSEIPSERAALAAICQYGVNAWIDCKDILSEDCFTLHENLCIYTCLESIFKNNPNAVVDLASILSAAQAVGLKELGEPHNVKYIKALFQYDVAEENARTFARKIRKLSECRQLIGSLDSAANKIRQVTGDEPISEISALAEKPIFDFTNKLMGASQQVEQIASGIDAYYEHLKSHQGELEGIKIGFPIYERAVGGIRTGVHIIGARKKVGKSYFALNAASWVTFKEKTPVLYLDTELHLHQGQWDRFIARFCNQEVEIDDIKYGRFFEDEKKERIVNRAKNTLKKLPLDYTNVTNKSMDEIISIMRRWVFQKVGYNKKGEINKCLIVYDYLKPPSNSSSKDVKEYMEMGYRLDALHSFTSQYSLPILSFVQLNREFDIGISDRIGWFATSYSSFLKKTPEEIASDGPAHGNRKLIFEDIRFGEGLDPGDYLNFHFSGKYSILRELKTRNQVEAEKQSNATTADGDH